MTTSESIQTVAVIGLGKLGLPMAACFAAGGLRVFGVDVDERRVKEVNGLAPSLRETGLKEMLRRAGDRLEATMDIESAVKAADATFIVVPTPSQEDGGFSLRYVLEACTPIGDALRDTHGFRVVVLTSTVLPGATGGEVQARLELTSGKTCGTDFGLCYSPEFIALGSVIDDFLHPDFVLIGESDSRSGELLAGVYQLVCENDPPVSRMGFANAEIAKLSVNTFVTTKIGFANMLAEMCEKVPDGDVDAVTSALALDRRIGGRYLTGGLGYGGPCFPRDNAALAAFARTVGVRPAIPEATDAANREHLRAVLAAVRSRVPADGTVGILGLSYKPSTDVVEASQGLELARALASEGLSVLTYDPVAAEQARVHLGAAVTFSGSVDECVQGSDVVVLATAWPEFASEVPRALKRSNGRRVVIDCWRILDPEQVRELATYIGLGVSGL